MPDKTDVFMFLVFIVSCLAFVWMMILAVDAEAAIYFGV